MSLFKITGIGTMVSGMLVLTGCATTSNHAPIPDVYVTPADTFQMDTFGTAVSTFAVDTVVQKGVFYYPLYVPYSLKTPSRYGFTYKSEDFNTYVTPDGMANALILDDYNDGLFVTEVAGMKSKISSIDQLQKAKPSKINNVLSQLAKKYEIEAGPGSVGESSNLVKKQSHPYETRRYTLISRDKKITVSDVKNDLMSIYYGRKVLPQTGIEARLGQHVFFIDVTTWSDMASKSKIHSAFFIHGVPLKNKDDEYKWNENRKAYLNATNFIQY
ncbi:hypothetical protein [Psychrobacter sp. AOP31-A1-22]|uniref:hypothetical protein n=1 Tax=Psychrobacter sp. AOP31-A1-22 TaxID=3457696 RepID=UPI004035628B